MKTQEIVVVGVGRIGAVTAVGLAHLDLSVTGFDRSASRIAELRSCEIPEAEPGLRAALRSAARYRSLTFTMEARESTFDLAFVCVDTPPTETGAADLSQVFRACQTAAALLRPHGTLVTRSTIPIGTGDRIAAMLAKSGHSDIDVVHVPEFLREGRAWEDFRMPDRVVIGAESDAAATRVARIFEQLERPLIITNRRTAELAKYAANAYLATSISFANEVSDLSLAMGIDASDVFSILRADRRIGEQAYLTPGLGFGGHCLPKDTAELEQAAQRHGLHLPQLSATRTTNARRAGNAVAWLNDALAGLDGKRIALLGLSFKPGTDDVRESPSLRLASILRGQGAQVAGWDPNVRSLDAPYVELAPSTEAALADAHAIVVAHGWQGWGNLDPVKLGETVALKLLYDAPGVLDPDLWRAAGWRLNRTTSIRPPRVAIEEEKAASR